MRIFHIIYSLRKGGAERVLLELCLSQINNGDTPKILSLYEFNDYKEDKYSVVDIVSVAKRGDRYLFSLKKFSRAIHNELIAQKFDAVIIHSRNAIIPLAFIKIRIPLIYIIQGNHYINPYSSLSNGLYYLLEKMVVRIKRLHIVVPNPAMVSLVRNIYNIKENNVLCIANGIDTDFFSFRGRVKKSRDVRKIAVIGTLHQGKNVDLSIKTFQELLKLTDNILLLIIGKGTEWENISDLISKHNLQDKVTMMGEVDNIHELYHEINLLWSFSSSEGLPTVLLESMSSGVPIVASNVIGNRDIIKHGVNGFLFNLDNVKNAAKFSERLLNDDTVFQKTTLSAREDVSLKFSINNMGNQYHELICAIADS